MRALTTALAVLVPGVVALGQELIPNPSFEQASGCPSGPSEIALADFWSAPTLGSSDYFNACDTGGSAGVPLNALGSQDAYHGSAYAGFILLYGVGDPEYREYVQSPILGGGLEAGKTYRFSMQLSLAEDSSAATDRIGAHFSPTAVSAADAAALPLVPQVETPAGTFLDDEIEWMEVDTTFVADGGEDFVTIGNFHDAADSASIAAGSGPDPPLHPGTAYYWLDMVSLQCQPCVHPPDDLLAWWPLHELGGPIAADIVYGIDGVHVDGPVPAPAYVGTGLEVLASGVSVPTDPYIEHDDGDFSMAAWVRVDALGTDQTLFSKIASASLTDPGYFIAANADGTIGFTMVDAALSSVTASSTEVLTAGEWAQVIVGVDRDDPSGGTIWVDNLPTTFDPTPAPGSLTNALPLRFAQDGGAGVGVDLAGALDEVQVYNRALGAEEVEYVWEARTAGQCPIYLELEPVVGIPITPGTPPILTTSGNLTNGSGATGTFTQTARGEPAGTRCGPFVSTVDGPANVTILGQQPLQVPAGGEVPLRFQLDQPRGLGSGLACFTVTTTHVESGRTFVSRGLIRGIQRRGGFRPR